MKGLIPFLKPINYFIYSLKLTEKKPIGKGMFSLFLVNYLFILFFFVFFVFYF